MPADLLLLNLSVVAGEVVAVLLLSALVLRLLRVALTRVTAAPALQEVADAVSPHLTRSVRWLTALAVLAVLGGNGWLIWQREVVHVYTLDRLAEVPQDVWINLALAAVQIVVLVVAASWLARRLHAALDVACARAKAYQGLTANDVSIDDLFEVIRFAVDRGGALAVLVAAAWIAGAPAIVTSTLLTVLEVVMIVAVGVMSWRGLDVVIVSLDAMSADRSDGDGLLRYYDRFAHLVPLLRRTVEYGIYIGTATLATRHVALESIAAWGPPIIRIIGVVFLARVAVELGNLLLDEALVTRARLDAAQRQRRLTILPLIKSILKYGVYFSASIYVLEQLGVDPTPILAGAGIIAMAVGLGAQNLINDMVSGFFILFENYFLVGDYIMAGGAQGVVEEIDIRTTRIRDDAGRLHIVRNGQIDDVLNYSKEFTFAVVRVGVAYDADVDEVFAVLEELGRTMAEERDDVLEPTVVRGIDGFGDSSVDMLTTTRVRPGRHRVVERDLRRRIKLAFDARGIDIPYAHQVVMLKQEEPAAEA